MILFAIVISSPIFDHLTLQIPYHTFLRKNWRFRGLLFSRRNRRFFEEPNDIKILCLSVFSFHWIQKADMNSFY